MKRMPQIMNFIERPRENQMERLSNLSGELFDLVVATCNLLAVHDISTVSILDKTFEEDRSAQGILEAIIIELEEFAESGWVGVPHEFDPGQGPNLIQVFEVLSK